MSDERIPADDGFELVPCTPSSTSRAAKRRADSPAARETETLDLPREYGGRKGPEPVRYGDWEKNGRCIDF